MEDDTHTDEVAARAKAGASREYERLFARLADRLLVYLRLRMGPALSAQVEPIDVLQEVYLEIHRSFHRFEPQGEGSFRGWAFRLADTTLRDVARRQTAQKRRPQRGFADTSGVWQQVRASLTGPATAAEQEEEHQRLHAALATLRPQERDAILLSHFQQRTHAEIAKHLGVSESSARRLVNRGRLALGAALR